MTPAQQEAVKAEAISWLGTPYHHAGAIKKVGVDCARLVIEIFANAGVLKRFEPDAYPPDWHLHRSEEKYLLHVEQRAEEVLELDVGDLVVMKFGRTFSHGAVYIGAGEIVHAYVNRLVEAARLADFADRDQKFFRVRA